MLKHQFKANVDVFLNNRTDILMQRKTVSQVAGLRQPPWQNFGKMENLGFELDVSYTKEFGDFSMDLNVNYSFAKNKITEYDEIPNKYDYYNSTGKSWNRNVLYVAERLYENSDFNISTDNNGKEVYALKQGIPVPSTFSPLPGDIKMADINNDGVIDSYDRTYAWGYSRDPQVMYGFGGSFEYKKSWYLSLFFQGRDQMTVVLTNGSIRPFSLGVNRSQARVEILDRWTKENPQQDVMFPRMTTTSRPSLNYDPSTWWARSGRYLKFKTLEFGYKFPQKTVSQLKLEAARLFFIGNNLFAWDDIKLWDPEMGDNGGMRYPISRTFSVGLELTF